MIPTRLEYRELRAAEAKGYELPKGWTLRDVCDERARYSIPVNHWPLATAGGAVGWGTYVAPSH